MKTAPSTPKDIDAYIAKCSPNVREMLEQVRAATRKAAPNAAETIKYGIRRAR
jgi:uncharacterized protein YdhG (YjbR/CyaY superfamily)